MKKEGGRHQDQHGMVPWNPCTYANKGLSTAGLLLRVSPKPTIRSKCGRPRSSESRVHHVGKAKDKDKDKAKAKGKQKQRSRDVVVSSYRLTSWRVADGGPGFKFSGLSTTGILDRLAAADYMDYDYDYDNDDVHEESGGLDYFPPDLIFDLDFVPSPLSIEIEAEDYGDLDGGDDDAMSFCEVGFLWEQVEGDEEGWCLVEEI